jgi:ribosomal protein S18 acetylase RimI-like enzyme
MDIIDFLPKYPNIDNTKYPALNPYEEDFYEAIFHKKEFYDLKLDRTETFPKGRGSLTKYQKTVARFISQHTPYDRLLVVHQMGLGKCVMPDTEICVNDTMYKIKDLWDEYMSSKTYIDNGGFWTRPKKVLLTDSLDIKNKLVYKKIINYIYRQYITEKVRKVTAENGYTITTTKAHKILTRQGWRNKLEVGDEIAINDKNFNVQNKKKIDFVKIIEIEEYDYKGWVFDLEINEYHNYVANGIFTHNTCAAIGAVEQIKESESLYNGALVLAKGDPMLDNFTNELLFKCTSGQYIPENYNKLSELERSHRIKKKITYYQLKTFAKFAKKLSKMSDEDITSSFSNKIIIIDEVHNLRPQEEQGELEIYNQFHRFLHLIHNCKVLFLSGTPMKDSPEEISSVANLMLPLDQQLETGEDFLNTYMIKEGNAYYLNPDKVQVLKDRLKGKISFLREPESTIPKEFIGNTNVGSLKHFIVEPNTMSSFQTKGYSDAYEKDKGGKKGVYINSREASLFVYPDGSYGKEGYKKYIKEVKVKKTENNKDIIVVSQYKMSDELYDALKGSDEKEILKNIKKHSVTYARVIEQILRTPGNCFVYSSLAKGSGGILFSLLLELFGFSKAKGKEKEKKLRYAILTNKTASATELKRIQNRFNNEDNKYGEYIKVIIGSKAVSEGFSFNNILFESINTPHWNYSETAQALARGTRLGSHNHLLKAGEKPVIKILQSVAIPKNKLKSIDLYLYEISEDKDISIRSILRLLMENAFDCALNYLRNYIDGKDGSRECDYTTCKYKCDGIDMREIGGIDEKDLDYSTYQLYYSNPKTSNIRKRIEQIMREKKKIDLDSIISNLKEEFTEDEIKTTLYLIQEETQSDEFDYSTFLRLYSNTPVKMIINRLEEMFRFSFDYSFESIVENFKDNTVFEILTALQIIINDNLVINNKYGLPCYLREYNNRYFLVNSLSIKSDSESLYYVKYPHITSGRSFSEIMNRVYSLSLPNVVNQISKIRDPKDLSKLIKVLPPSIQELFIESSLTAKDKKIKTNKDLRKMLLDFFKSYIKKIDGVWVSTFLQDEKVLRCNDVNGELSEWKNCDAKYNQLLEEYEAKKQQQLRDENPYGIMGKFNPENNAFCIVDFKKEKEAQEKVAGRRKSSATDKRITYSGKVCGAGGWKLEELIEIAVNRVKIDPPKAFRKNDTEQTMLDKIRKDPKLSVFLPQSYNKEDLRRLLYWATGKKDGGNRGSKPICEALRKWFEENGYLEVDNMCGVQGKKKLGAKEKEEKKGGRTFRIESIIPSKDADRFNAFRKDMAKLMEECFDIKKYKAPVDNNTWILVFSKKKLVGFIMVDNDNVLWNVCVAKNYRRQGIATQAMKQATDYICNLRGKTPSLYVDNKDNKAKKLIRMYSSFGFEIVKTDDKYTYMQHSCKI